MVLTEIANTGKDPKEPKGAIHFTNELDNKISVKVYEKEIEGVEGVMIYISGPTSCTENHITRMEAERIYAELGEVLEKTT